MAVLLKDLILSFFTPYQKRKGCLQKLSSLCNCDRLGILYFDFRDWQYSTMDAGQKVRLKQNQGKIRVLTGKEKILGGRRRLQVRFSDVNEWCPALSLEVEENDVSSQKVLANDSSIILEDMHSNDDVRWFFIFTSTF